MSNRKLKEKLDKLYDKYNRIDLIKPDPLQFVYRYSNPVDREIAAFLAAVLAYGRVEQIQKSLDNLLSFMSDGPYEFVMSLNCGQKTLLKDFKHRFNTGDDIYLFLQLIKAILKKNKSIEEFFLKGYKGSDKNIIPSLSNFCTSLHQLYSNNNKGEMPRSLAYLLPNPLSGSACKRLNLFLRWMVREDNVDVGLWKNIDKRKLIIPMDVHISKLCKELGFYKRKTISLAAAIEITDNFSKIEPSDPVKYDFALCRTGMLEVNRGWIN
ncbi:MAG: TIGR02757 family protein [Planctomycetota bacterium]|jgi:uncharacterized protein (TIGR02757 family)